MLMATYHFNIEEYNIVKGHEETADKKLPVTKIAIDKNGTGKLEIPASDVIAAKKHATGYLSIHKLYHEPPPPPSDEILDLDLSVRGYNALNNAGIKKVSDLSNYTKDQLLQLPNFGKTS